MKINATWNDGEGRNGAYVTPQGWLSEDGDIWTDEYERPISGAEFDDAEIVLIGGPRDGETVA